MNGTTVVKVKHNSYAKAAYINLDRAYSPMGGSITAYLVSCLNSMDSVVQYTPVTYFNLWLNQNKVKWKPAEQ